MHEILTRKCREKPNKNRIPAEQSEILEKLVLVAVSAIKTSSNLAFVTMILHVCILSILFFLAELLQASKLSEKKFTPIIFVLFFGFSFIDYTQFASLAYVPRKNIFQQQFNINLSVGFFPLLLSSFHGHVYACFRLLVSFALSLPVNPAEGSTLNVCV